MQTAISITATCHSPGKDISTISVSLTQGASQEMQIKDKERTKKNGENVAHYKRDPVTIVVVT